jgi:hypothetical protein
MVKKSEIIFERIFYLSLLDIIFFIYLYQRYMYPVDRTRVNEFGTTGETDSAVVPVENEILGSSQIEQSIADTTNEQHEKVE